MTKHDPSIEYLAEVHPSHLYSLSLKGSVYFPLVFNLSLITLRLRRGRWWPLGHQEQWD